MKSKTNEKIFQYFRDSCRGLDMATARGKIQKRFKTLTAAKWYRLKPALERLRSGDGQSLTDPPNELTCSPPSEGTQLSTIPESTPPEAKVALAQLMAINSQQEARCQTLQVENSALRDRVGRSESRIRVLVGMLKVVLGAIQ